MIATTDITVSVNLLSWDLRKRHRNSTYRFWLSQALTTNPPLPWHEPEKVLRGTFPAYAKEWREASIRVVRA